MPLLDYITEYEIVEGILGAIGFVFFSMFLREYVEMNIFLEGLIAWTCFWWLRKVGLNVYIKLKNKKIR